MTLAGYPAFPSWFWPRTSGSILRCRQVNKLPSTVPKARTLRRLATPLPPAAIGDRIRPGHCHRGHALHNSILGLIVPTHRLRKKRNRINGQPDVDVL